MTFVIKESWAKLAFLGSIAVAVAGTIVTMCGLASMQVFCEQNNGVYAGVKQEYMFGAKASYYGIQCSEFWRFEWWGWSLQVFFLILAITAWRLQIVRIYKSALWALASTVIVLNMTFANHLIDQYERTIGDLHVRGIVTFVGFTITCGGDYLMMFTACALYHEVRGQMREAEGIPDDNGKLRGANMA